MVQDSNMDAELPSDDELEFNLKKEEKPKFGNGAIEILNEDATITNNLKADKLGKLDEHQAKIMAILRNAMSTEVMIDKLLRVIESDQPSKVEWPFDAFPNTRLNCNLSFTKMINETNHSEPRRFNKEGVVEPLSVYSTSTGWHSSWKWWRNSEIEMLGPGINLYMKLLKYFTLVFLVITILSVPSILIFSGGKGYNGETELTTSAKIAQFTLGNLGQNKDIII